MKKLIIGFIIFLSAVTGYGQQAHLAREQYERKLDSAIAIRTIQKMQALFSLSSKQQQDLTKATSMLNRSRQSVFMEYRKTPSLQQKMQQHEQMQDSVYQSIVGEVNYSKYKEAVAAERKQKQAAMAGRMRARFGTVDTVNNKPPVKPLN